MSHSEALPSALFASLAGSSRLYDKLAAAEALHAVDRCMKRMTRGIDALHGRVVRTGRDDLTALFDNANDACQAAIALQHRIADLPPVCGIQLTLRIGFAHGPASEDHGEIRGDGLRTAEKLAALAAAGQILTTRQTQSLLSPHLQSSIRPCDSASGKDLTGDRQACEVLWQELEPGAEARSVVLVSPAPSSERELRLCVRYADQVKVLDQYRPSVALGRDVSCEITLHSRRVSRQHARIELQGAHFVLSDRSTNGTFVTINGEPEVFIRHDQLVLRGSGIFSFAASAGGAHADIAEFEHL